LRLGWHRRKPCAPFDQPALRDEIENARREREQIIDHINLDQVTFSGFSEQAEAQAKALIQTFADYLKQHKDEIAALDFFYQQPYQRRALTFDMIKHCWECALLDICKLASAGGLEVGASTSLVLGDDVIRVKAESETSLLLLYQIAFVEHRYRLAIEALTEPFREHFTRTRIRFLCPGCGVRCRYLYLRGRFACQKCQNLNTPTWQANPNILPGERVAKLRQLLKAGDTPVDQIKRPAGMHRERFDWRIARLRELEPVAAADIQRYMARSGLGAVLEAIIN
jgi:hypothetical protein